MTATQHSGETVEVAQPIEQLADDDVTEVDARMADIAAAMDTLHPPTNRRLLLAAADYWCDVSGPNDPIVESLVAWVAYLQQDDRSQHDVGMDGDRHMALRARLEELGLADDD